MSYFAVPVRRPAATPRAKLEALIDAAVHGEIAMRAGEAERLIAMLDELDGDPDVEPCEAGDDGCHYLDICPGKGGWGHASDSVGAAPEYGEDQSAGPLNSMGRPITYFRTLPWGA